MMVAWSRDDIYKSKRITRATYFTYLSHNALMYNLTHLILYIHVLNSLSLRTPIFARQRFLQPAAGLYGRSRRMEAPWTYSVARTYSHQQNQKLHYRCIASHQSPCNKHKKSMQNTNPSVIIHIYIAFSQLWSLFFIAMVIMWILLTYRFKALLPWCLGKSKLIQHKAHDVSIWFLLTYNLEKENTSAIPQPWMAKQIVMNENKIGN